MARRAAHPQDMFLPVVAPWLDKETKVDAVAQAYGELPVGLGRGDRGPDLGRCCSTSSATASFDASALAAIRPTIAEALQDPSQLTFSWATYDPDYPTTQLRGHRRRHGGGRRAGGAAPVVDGAAQPVPVGPGRRAADRRRRAEPTTTWWSCSSRRAPRCCGSCDKVAKGAPRAVDRAPRVALASHRQIGRPSSRSGPTRRSTSRKQFAVLPKIEALAVVKGEILCSNDDLIRNAAYSWSPMSGRRDQLEDRHRDRACTPRAGWRRSSLDAAKAALARAGRQPEEIGAVAVLLVHHRPVDAVDGDLADRAAGHAPDAHVGRPHRRLRRPAVRAVRGGPAAAGGQPAGAAGLRGEVLRQDRHRPPVPDDLR